MNEKDKRELMLRFAANNGGEMRKKKAEFLSLRLSDNKPIMTRYDASYGRFRNMLGEILEPNKYVLICNREEFYSLIDSLFKDAPDGATHLDINDSTGSKWIWFDGERWFHRTQVGSWFPWIRNENDELIPRPRNQEEAEWIPEAGEKCLAWAEKIDHEKMIEAYYIGDNPTDEKGMYKVFVSKNGTPFTTSNFRPTKTEAEKEREAGIKALTEILAKGVGDCEPDEYLATQIWDAGYRLQE